MSHDSRLLCFVLNKPISYWHLLLPSLVTLKVQCTVWCLLHVERVYVQEDDTGSSIAIPATGTSSKLLPYFPLSKYFIPLCKAEVLPVLAAGSGGGDKSQFYHRGIKAWCYLPTISFMRRNCSIVNGSVAWWQEYQERIREEIEKEQERKDLLLNRVKQLENQINTLIQDSLGLLKVAMSLNH